MKDSVVIFKQIEQNKSILQGEIEKSNDIMQTTVATNAKHIVDRIGKENELLMSKLESLKEDIGGNTGLEIGLCAIGVIDLFLIIAMMIFVKNVKVNVERVGRKVKEKDEAFTKLIESNREAFSEMIRTNNEHLSKVLERIEKSIDKLSDELINLRINQAIKKNTEQ